MNEILIVGGDSTIGNGLVKKFETEGNLVLSTTVFKNMVNERCFFLDLSDDIDDWHLPSTTIKTAIICAAITSQEQCQLNPENSWRVNVRGTVSLVKRLVKAGIFVIFLSSNAVFKGEFPFSKATDPVTPQIEYGRHKAEAEEEFLKLGDKVAIVRFSKVITPEMPLITNWINDLRTGNVIHPFFDMVIAPVPLTFAVGVLQEVALKNISGIIQVSAKQDVTYADLAKHIAGKLGFDEDLIQPISYRDIGLTYAAKNTTLDSSRLTQLGMLLPDLWASVDETFGLDRI